MKIKFYWEFEFFDEPFARGINDTPAFKNCDPLVGILTDDGGLGFKAVIERAKDGIEETKKVIEGQLEREDITSETFSADIGRELTELYFNFDDSYTQFIPTTMFLTILTEWYEFIKLPPEKDATKMVEV